MILPSKKLSLENSLIHIGGTILAIMDEPKTVSRVWEEFKSRRSRNYSVDGPEITYDWFVLAIDVLFILGAIELLQGRLHRRST